MRATVALATILAGCALAAPGCAKLDFFKRREPPREEAGPRIGSAAPDFSAQDLDGKPLKLSDYRGKVVVLVFWFSRCPPCKAMIPHERDMVERYRDKPFAMIGVYSDQDYDAARALIAERHMTWPIVKAESDAITQRYGVQRFPSVFVIDAAGVIRGTGASVPHLDATVATLLEQIQAKK